MASFVYAVANMTPQAAMSSMDNISDFANNGIRMAIDLIWQHFTISFLGKALLLFFVAVNFKSFPLIYHLRILNGIRFVLRSQRSPRQLTPDQLFQPLITSSKAPLMEIDVFGHKSNSTYFSDLDVARTHFVTTMFSRAIEEFRGSTTMNGLSRQPKSAFTMPLGAVSCVFKRELKPYEAYDMWTKVLAWDEKWFYLVTHFVKRGAKIEPSEHTMYPQQNKHSVDSQGKPDTSKDNAICASALSKVVFKNGRITIAPKVMLEFAGLIPTEHSEPEGKAPELEQAQIKANTADGLPNKDAVKPVEEMEGSDNDSGYNGSRRTSIHQTDVERTREKIEEERQRGMEIAGLLAAQSQLEDEFVGNEGAALGRHYDGHGIEGVVSTLAQLGKLSKYQLL